jgi:hypothetical protein
VYFCLQPYALFTLSLPLHIIYLLHLLSTNHKCTQPCYFPPAIQTYCSEAEEDFGVLQYGVLDERLPPVDCLWCYGVFPLQCFRECLTQSFVMTLFGKYIIYCDIGYPVSIFCTVCV